MSMANYNICLYFVLFLTIDIHKFRLHLQNIYIVRFLWSYYVNDKIIIFYMICWSFYIDYREIEYTLTILNSSRDVRNQKKVLLL